MYMKAKYLAKKKQGILQNIIHQAVLFIVNKWISVTINACYKQK